MRLRFFIPALAALAAGGIHISDARACGGCFHPPIIQQGESTVVTGHRMAFATSPTQTVLWDQIAYSGDPKEFAWVLPVRAGAMVEESNDAWFEALEAATAVQVTSPVIHCPEIERPREGCAASLAGGGAQSEDFAGPGNGGTVNVVHHGTVGPYETVTLSTTTPGALNTWLTDHGFNVDADIQPVIDQYVAEGFDFIALRLLPNKGIREMKPVRVRSPGGGITLPLRMVAAGTGANVAITLYTITESRQKIEQYTNTTVPESILIWDYATQSSNYATMRQAVLAQNGGMTWVTAFAHDGGLLSPLPGGWSLIEGYDDLGQYYSYPRTIADIYVTQGVENGETTNEACRSMFRPASDSTSLVVDPCPAGVAPDDPSCGTVAAGQLDARALACGGLDDVKVALTGMHPRDVWITRLEADLPRAALANDLTIGPAGEQKALTNHLQAPVGINAEGLCPTSVPPLSMIAPGYGKASGSGRRVDRTAVLGYAVMGLLITGAVARRRRRR